MENELVTAMEIGAGAVAHSLSPWELFLQADIIVKAVIILLIVCSFWSWAIIFDTLKGTIVGGGGGLVGGGGLKWSIITVFPVFWSYFGVENP